VETNDIALVQLLLDHGADSNVADGDGHNALFIAARIGHVLMMGMLVQRGLSVQTIAKMSHTLLMTAAVNGRKAAVEWLLQQGVAVDAVNNIGGTALHMACGSDSDDAGMIELLVARGADVLKRVEDGRTALDLAVHYGNLECAKALIAGGADVTHSDSRGVTSLHVALEARNSAVVQLLLEHGATAVLNSVVRECCTGGTQCCSSATALMMCSEVDTFKFLLATGADVHATNGAGDTCLHVAAKHNWKAPMLCLMIKTGADLHAVNNEGKTAAELAHDRGYTLSEQLLVRAAQQGH
jgi:ankyrin repeat protein